MNIFIHEDFKKEERKRIRRRQLIGIGLFLVSFVLSFASLVPPFEFLVFVAYPFLLVGVPIWMSARTAERKLGSGPQADVLINAEMKGLSNKYSLHHYPRLNGVPVQHLFIMPAGVLVMAANDAIGPVTCKGSERGDRWSAPSNFLDKLTGSKPPVGNPSLDVDNMVAAARTLVDSIGKPNVPVKGLVLFTRNPDVEVHECSYGAAPLNEIRLAIRDLELSMEGDEGAGDVSSILTSEDRRKLNNILAPVSVPAASKAEKPTRPASARKRA